MHDLTDAGTLLAQSREKVYAAQAPQMIARRELELLQAAARSPRQPRSGFRQALVRVGARLVGGASSPATRTSEKHDPREAGWLRMKHVFSYAALAPGA